MVSFSHLDLHRREDFLVLLGESLVPQGELEEFFVHSLCHRVPHLASAPALAISRRRSGLSFAFLVALAFFAC